MVFEDNKWKLIVISYVKGIFLNVWKKKKLQENWECSSNECSWKKSYGWYEIVQTKNFVFELGFFCTQLHFWIVFLTMFLGTFR